MRTCLELLDLLRPVEADMCAVEKEIARLIEEPVPIVRDVTMHTLGAGGKRLRPLLTLLSAKAVGEINFRVITLASLVELSHTAALIHDEVIEQAEIRRGLPAANGVWGNEATVLVGDYLTSQMAYVLSDDEFRTFQRLVTVAAKRMCVGRLLEIELRRKLDITEDEYKQLIQLKTSELISAACQLGAMAAYGSDIEIQALGDYGIYVGMASQIIDDLLDIISDYERQGKLVGNDLREGKITLPYIRALSVADRADQKRLKQLLSENYLDEAVIEEAISIVRRYDSITYSLQVAHDYIQASHEALSPIAPSPIKSILQAVTEFVIVRQA